MLKRERVLVLTDGTTTGKTSHDRGPACKIWAAVRQQNGQFAWGVPW